MITINLFFGLLKSEEEIREFIEKISLYVVGVLIRIE
jgi:hypothetical protein